MSKWTDNLMLYCDTGRVGNCPKCKSENVKVEEHKHGHRVSLTFICGHCKSMGHFDGADEMLNRIS